MVAWVGEAARLAGWRRRVAQSQVTASFPERSSDWAAEVARECYRHFSRELAVSWRASRSPGTLEATFSRIAGVEEFVRSLDYGRREGTGGAVVVTGHLGNWELGAAATAQSGTELVAAVQPQGWLAGPLLGRMRRGLGIRVTHRGPGQAGVLLRAARTGVAAVVADQHAPGGEWVQFLGRPARASRGPAKLSIAAGVPLYFAALVRDAARDSEGYRFVYERMDDGSKGPTGAGVPAGVSARELTVRWMAALEREIRRRPEQYFWFHRRWKGSPPESSKDNSEESSEGGF